MLFLECDFQMIPSPLEDDWNRKLSGSFLLELELIGFEIEIGLCNCESEKIFWSSEEFSVLDTADIHPSTNRKVSTIKLLRIFSAQLWIVSF